LLEKKDPRREGEDRSPIPRKEKKGGTCAIMKRSNTAGDLDSSREKKKARVHGLSNPRAITSRERVI